MALKDAGEVGDLGGPLYRCSLAEFTLGQPDRCFTDPFQGADDVAGQYEGQGHADYTGRDRDGCHLSQAPP